MADKYVNEVGVQAIRNWAEDKFALDSDLDTLSNKVDEIVSEGGEPNTIESISVNGTDVTPDGDKNVALTVPTKTSDLTNDGDGTSNFATENYVTTNGGKIDKIQVNGTDQTIGDNKTVNITVPTKVSDLTNDGDGTSGSAFATESYVDTNGGKIDTIKINGSEQTITEKTVDITVPTQVSDLTNDSGFQTADEVESAINTKVASAYKYKSSVADLAALEAVTEKEVGDVQATGMNYAWNGTEWDSLGQYVDTSVMWTSTTGQSNTLEAMTVTEINAILNPSTGD